MLIDSFINFLNPLSFTRLSDDWTVSLNVLDIAFLNPSETLTVLVIIFNITFNGTSDSTILIDSTIILMNPKALLCVSLKLEDSLIILTRPRIFILVSAYWTVSLITLVNTRIFCLKVCIDMDSAICLIKATALTFTSPIDSDSDTSLINALKCTLDSDTCCVSAFNFINVISFLNPSPTDSLSLTSFTLPINVWASDSCWKTFDWNMAWNILLFVTSTVSLTLLAHLL